MTQLIKEFKVDGKWQDARNNVPNWTDFRISIQDEEGKVVDGMEVVINHDDLKSVETYATAAGFGLSTRTGNTFNTNKKATVHERFEAVVSVAENIMTGVWSVRGDGSARASDLVVALCQLQGIEVEAAMKKLKAMASDARDAFLAKLKASPAIEAKADEIKAKRAAERAKASKDKAKGDTTDLGAFATELA